MTPVAADLMFLICFAVALSWPAAKNSGKWNSSGRICWWTTTSWSEESLEKPSWLGLGFRYLLLSPRTWGRWTHFWRYFCTYWCWNRRRLTIYLLLGWPQVVFGWPQVVQIYFEKHVLVGATVDTQKSCSIGDASNIREIWCFYSGDFRISTGAGDFGQQVWNKSSWNYKKTALVFEIWYTIYICTYICTYTIHI